MIETTALNRISKIIDSMNYETVYIEIQTKSDKYTLNKEKITRVIGFNTEMKNNK